MTANLARHGTSCRAITLCREFTINLISEWFVEAANHTCGNYDRGVNEIDLSGLTPIPSVKVWLQWL